MSGYAWFLVGMTLFVCACLYFEESVTAGHREAARKAGGALLAIAALYVIGAFLWAPIWGALS